jgi:hypothetical protein
VHENFELVLDPTVLKRKASIKRFTRKRMRIKRIVEQEERRRWMVLRYTAITQTLSKDTQSQEIAADLLAAGLSPIDENTASKAPVHRPAAGIISKSVQKMAARSRSREAKELVASLMKDGELLGEEYLRRTRIKS